jgi:hypothetical protein
MHARRREGRHEEAGVERAAATALAALRSGMVAGAAAARAEAGRKAGVAATLLRAAALAAEGCGGASSGEPAVASAGLLDEVGGGCLGVMQHPQQEQQQHVGQGSGAEPGPLLLGGGAPTQQAAQQVR